MKGKTIGPLGGLDMNAEATRSNYVKLAEELESMYQQNPDDTATALAYAEKLLQLGNLKESQEVLAPILAGGAPDPQTVYLSAQIEYLSGNYEQAESLYETLLNECPEYKAKAEFGLEYVYYQTNQYQKAQVLSGANSSDTGIGALMKAFGSREPYKASWTDKRETVIPFLITDPLPVVQIEINGEMYNFLIDTGAPETYLNELVAETLGIQPIATQIGEYAGGITVETKYGIADSMKLKDVTLESVPVNIAQLDHIEPIGDFKVSGVFGTGVFRQFHITMDYLNGELVLKPRGEHTQVESVVSELPFAMTDTHFMLCKAIVNGKEMNIFPDSGLKPEGVSLLLANRAMDYAGIPIPEMIDGSELDGGGGLGGSNFTVGYFTVDTYQMGDLPVVNDMVGVYGIFPENYYFNENFGLFVDGIISHNYLKDYKWTIDFDSMTMTFSK